MASGTGNPQDFLSLFVWVFVFNLAARGVSCSMRDGFQLWHVRSSSLTRDGAQAAALGVQS